jgi:FkbM family methyltransferase
VSDPAASESRPFNHFPLKHRLVAWVSINLFDNITYTVSHGLLKGMKRRGGLGWVPSLLAPRTVTKEELFWSQLDLKDMTVYDIGAFHGLLSLFFSSRAAQVISFEPNSRNRRRLEENLALNSVRNVRVRPVGVSSRKETLRMVGSPLMPGGSSVDAIHIEGLLNSGTGTVVEEISVVSLDEEVAEANLPPPDFIKIDIEGWEIHALEGARQTLARHRPALFLEMHGETIADKRNKVAAIVDFLWQAGYRNILHIESGKLIAPENSSVALEGHLYCRVSE